MDRPDYIASDVHLGAVPRETETEFLARSDAAAQAIVDGTSVRVSSRRGAITIAARISDRVTPGMVFIPMHWGDHYTPGGAINILTNDAYDPFSKQPEYKACAVAITAS